MAAQLLALVGRQGVKMSSTTSCGRSGDRPVRRCRVFPAAAFSSAGAIVSISVSRTASETSFAVAVGTNQIPDQQTLRERQGFKDVGDVCRMILSSRACNWPICRLKTMSSTRSWRGISPTVHEIFDQPMAGEQFPAPR